MSLKSPSFPEVVACIMVFSLTGCIITPPNERTHVKRIDGIERVFLHDEHHYSIVVRQGDGKTLVHRQLYNVDQVSYMDDVPSGEPMHAIVRTDTANSEYEHKVVEFHIRSPADLNGGGWHRSGKTSRSGETIVVE